MPTASREIWRDALPKVNFAEAYNLDRYEDVQEAEDAEVGAAPRNGGKFMSFLARFQQPQNNKDPSLSARGARHMYTKIRSDLDEDKGDDWHDDLYLPNMPLTWSGMARHAFELDVGLSDGPDAASPSMCTLDCVDSPLFHALSGLVIVANAAIIGLETDIKSEVWWWMDQFMLSFFTTELMLKLCRHGLMYFRHEEEWHWNSFDCLIVTTGLFDQWFMPAYQAVRASLNENGKKHGRSKMTVIFMLLRMARLLRIVRLFRLIKIIRPLFELAQGILEALQGMFWVLVFMMMTLYTCAILCSLFIGDGEIFDADVPPAATEPYREMFRSVSSSLFALFGTMSSWSLTKLVPLFKEVPAFRLFFVIFYIYSAWALLAVMTGVVSENMIAIREQMLREDAKKEEMKKEYILHFLSDLFRSADADNSGQISKDEFDMMLRAPELVKKLMKYSKMEPKDLEELFEWIDHDGSGTINLEEFMEGFKWINEPLRAKSLVTVHHRLGGDAMNLRTSVIAAFERKVEEMNSLIAEPMRKVHAICEQMQTLDITFAEFSYEIRQPMEVPTQQEVRAVEQRLSDKLGKVIDRLAQVESY